MLLNYLKVAIRTLISNKTFSFINISGLSIGIAASVLIMMVVIHEFSYDRFHAKGDRIFRVEKQFTRDGRHSLYANPEFAPTLQEKDHRVTNYVRTFSGGRKIFKSDDSHVFFEDKFLFADSSFFSVFSFPLVSVNRDLIARPGTVIITEATALKYFGSENAIGKLLTFDRKYQLEVIGVAQDPPVNSTIQFGMVASFATMMTMPDERDLIINDASGFPTYVLLNDRGDELEVARSIANTTYTNANIIYSISPLYDNHFDLNFGSTATTQYAYTFLSVAFLILLLALINYMNLTTARSTARAKEVGIRKAIGASRFKLSSQFYFESAIVTTVAFLVALALIELCRQPLTNVLGLQFDESFLRSPYLYAAIGTLLLVSIVIAGSYPAFILSKFRAAEVLKGEYSIPGAAGSFRKVLIIFQFTISCCLAICAGVMNKQLSYMSSLDSGVDRQRVIAVPAESLTKTQRKTLKEQLSNLSGIEAVGIASMQLYKDRMSGVSMVTSPITNEKVGAKWMVADEDFAATLGIDFNRTPVPNQQPYHLLNESAAKAFGLNNLGRDYSITMGGDHVPAISGKIDGVVRDFNFESPRNQIQPLILSVVADSAAYLGDNPTLYIRFSKGDVATDAIASTYSKISGGLPFSYYFLDDAFNDQQVNEARLNNTFRIFTIVAVTIACLGLFGLITFTSERRKKELSIRKILGANTTNLLILVSSDLILLLFASFVISVPVAIYLAREWLSGFFYQAGVSLQDVALPIASILFASVVVISVQAIRTAQENAVNNLKSE